MDNMAYTVWGIFMKKYTKVRKGLRTRALPVSGRADELHKGYDSGGSDSPTESWHTANEDLSFAEQNKKQTTAKPKQRVSKAKRVKNYLKRCKTTANQLIQQNQPVPTPPPARHSVSFSRAPFDQVASNGGRATVQVLQPVVSHTSWYVNDEFCAEEIAESHVTVKHVLDAAKHTVQETECDAIASVHRAVVEDKVVEISVQYDVHDITAIPPQSPLLPPSLSPFNRSTSLCSTSSQCSSEDLSAGSNPHYQDQNINVAGLVDQYFGQYYRNYNRTRRILVRQARDVLVCDYRGNLNRFQNEYCVPVSALLDDIYKRAKVHVGSVVASRGWPLSVGRDGISLHLSDIEPALLRNSDCYLSVRLSANCSSAVSKPNLILNWRANHRIFRRSIPRGFDSPLEIMAGGTVAGAVETEGNQSWSSPDINHKSDESIDLSMLLKNLVVTVDRAIERIPLENLAFPCPQCFASPIGDVFSLRCRCVKYGKNGEINAIATGGGVMVEKKDTSIQTSPIFEVDTVFPHIDSDEDFEFVGHNQNGSTDVATQYNRKHSERSRETFRSDAGTSFIYPTAINDLHEKLLMSGIVFPGTVDKLGRSVIVYDTDTVTRSEMNAVDIAKIIFYYSTISVRLERFENSISILTISPESLNDIDLLDSALSLLTPRVRIDCVLVVWKKNDYHRIRHFKSNHPRFSSLQNSKIQYRVLTESDSLEEYIEWSQIPSEVGGESTHNQLEWIQFYKEVELFLMKCHSCGRRLVNVMLKLKGDTVPLYSQQYLINWLLNDIELRNLRAAGDATLAQIEEKAQWLPNSMDVRVAVERCERLFAEVLRAAKRLEQLAEKRKDKLQEVLRVKALEKETTEVISWLTNNGEDELKQHSDLANNLPDIRQQEQDFEKFYYISMRNLDKAGDLLEEAGQCSGGTSLKDLARSLKLHLRGFSDRLEDTRERLEDTSRCFYLLDRAYEWALDAMKYMSRIKPQDVQNPGQSVRQLRQYLMGHPPPTNDHFNEMLHLAQKLQNDKLSEQCKVAQCRCEETLENIRSMIGSDGPCWAAVSTSTPLGRRRSLPLHNQTSSQLPEQPSYVCWEQSATDCHSPLDNIPEEFYCNNAGSANRAPNPLQRSCTWQYQTENYDDEDKLSSSADNTTEGSEAGTKSSSDDIEEVNDSHTCGSTPIPPVPVNSHLYRNDSLHLNTNCGQQTLKKQKTAKLIMREMVQTERDYVKALEYVIENYIPELVREDIPQALRGQRNVIFGNIEKIYEFHSQNFLHELEQCEHNPFAVGQSFLQYEKKFYLYALYNKNKPKSDSLMAEYGTSFFKSKQLALSDKMDLASYLLKPVQRMGKYALLLQQLMKVARTDISELREADEMVRFQLRHGNDLLAMDSLKECDVNLKEQGRLLRQSEFLVSQGKGKKCFRHVFLFEELILFSKARRFPDRKNLDLYIYKNSIKTSDIGLTAKVGDSSTKFEIWYRKRKPSETFTLQSMSEDIKQAWTEELSNLLWKQAFKNREIRMAEMSSMGIGNKPCLDIRPSADQISDRSISIAQLCKTAPRFRNSIAVSTLDSIRKRPHSVISVSSNSSSAGSSSSNGENKQTTSHCSSAESGIVTDWNTNTMSTNSSIVSDSNSPSHQMSVKL